MSKPWIETVADDDAKGLLAKHFKAAIERAGKVFNIVRIMSLRPGQLRDSMAHYRSVMFGEGGVTRAEREMLATVVSRANDCYY